MSVCLAWSYAGMIGAALLYWNFCSLVWLIANKYAVVLLNEIEKKQYCSCKLYPHFHFCNFDNDSRLSTTIRIHYWPVLFLIARRDAIYFSCNSNLLLLAAGKLGKSHIACISHTHSQKLVFLYFDPHRLLSNYGVSLMLGVVLNDPVLGSLVVHQLRCYRDGVGYSTTFPESWGGCSWRMTPTRPVSFQVYWFGGVELACLWFAHSFGDAILLLIFLFERIAVQILH